MREGIVVNLTPILSHKSRHKQNKGALALMKISNENIYQTKPKPGHNDYTCARFYFFQASGLQIIYDSLQGLFRTVFVISKVWSPLLYILRLTLFKYAYTYLI